MPCSYKGCDLPVMPGEDTCFGHAPIDRKGLSGRPFYDEFSELFLQNREMFDGFIFPGDFSLTSFHFNHPLSFVGAVFLGHCNLSGVQFPAIATFDRAVFRNGLTMQGADFKGPVSFKGAEFYPAADPNEEEFICSIDAASTQFHEDVDFDGAKFFDRDISFHHAEFSKGVNFRGALFQCRPSSGEKLLRVDFASAKFMGSYARFFGAVVQNAELQFLDTHFESCRVSLSFKELSNSFLEIQRCTILNCDEFSFKGFPTKTRSDESFTIKSSKILLSDSQVDSSILSFQGCRSKDSELHMQFRAVNKSIVNLRELVLVQGQFSFTGTVLSKSNVYISGARLSGTSVEFRSLRIEEANAVDCSGAHFECETNTFSNLSIGAESISFWKSVFWGQTIFKEVDFRSDKISFTASSLLGDTTEFNDCKFFGDVSFRGNDLANRIEFVDIRFSDQATFRFADPAFQLTSKGGNPPVIVFRRVKFNPFLTFFENVKLGEVLEGEAIALRPLVAFRFSLLRDVYFSKNDMSLFSFYTSAYFEDSFFTSINSWLENDSEKVFRRFRNCWLLNPRYKRPFLIREDILLPVSA